MITNNNFFPQYPQNIISGQILQASSLESISNARFAPNSSALIAHQSLPIVYRCIADSLGNVTTTAFDISIHKSEEEVKEETLNNRISALEQHLMEIEDLLKPRSSDYFSA